MCLGRSNKINFKNIESSINLNLAYQSQAQREVCRESSCFESSTLVLYYLHSKSTWLNSYCFSLMQCNFQKDTGSLILTCTEIRRPAGLCCIQPRSGGGCCVIQSKGIFIPLPSVAWQPPHEATWFCASKTTSTNLSSLAGWRRSQALALVTQFGPSPLLGLDHPLLTQTLLPSHLPLNSPHTSLPLPGQIHLFWGWIQRRGASLNPCTGLPKSGGGAIMLHRTFATPKRQHNSFEPA